MGQQQIMLMLVLVVIVGIITILAIDTFTISRNEGIKDIIRQDVMEAATLGQMYYKKSSIYGGGGNSFKNITLFDIQLDSSNVTSAFVITEVQANYFKLKAIPFEDISSFTAIVYIDKIVWETHE